MSRVDFEITFKAVAQNLTDYLDVRQRVNETDVSGMGYDVVKTIVKDDEVNFEIISTITGHNDPPV